jgi:hypothetical protein
MGLPRLSTYPRGRRQGNLAKPTVVHLLIDIRNALGLVSPPEGVVNLTFGDPAVLAFQL